MTQNSVKCAKCGNDVHPLEVFPQTRCLACYERDMGSSMPTAAELTAMWVGKAR